MGDQSRPPGHQHPDHIFHLAKFHMFTTTEVLRLSTKEITERKTFDELGHPIPNGLYDAALGPIEAHERCHTCQLLCSHCPGHVGHIQLPLPVFNPVLLDTTYKLFRGSCVFCHRFFCTKSILPVQLCLTQLALIDSGKLLEAHNVMEEVGGKDLDNVLVAADIEDKLKQLADSANLSVDDKKSVKERQLERNAGQARTALLTNFQRNYLYKVKTKCPHCNERQPRMRNEYSRIFALDFSKAVEATKKKYGNPDAGSKDEEYDPISGALEASNGIQEKIDPEDFLKNLLENAMGGPAITTPKSAKKSKKGKEGSEQKVVETPTDVRPGIEKQLDQIRQGAGSTHLLWGAAEVREHFRLLWDREADFLLNLFPMFRSAKQELDGAKRMSSQALFGVDMDSMRPIDILFSELTVVPPSKFRPPQFLNGEKYESGQTIALKNVMEQARLVGAILRLLHGRGTSAELLSLKEIVLTAMPKESDHSQRLRKAQVQLQTKVNSVFDSDLDSYDSKGNAGIRQLLEKKEDGMGTKNVAGLFRKHMMGKRVNYAARSVITPDPYLAIDEIGVPEVFAKRLTFPEPVNDLNLPYMRKLLQAGPNVHPGANFFEDEFGTKQMIDTKDKFQRGNLVGRLTTPHAYSTLPPKTVMRQLRSGDALIMNRQPTLHKPSIMAHKTKVLGYQKAFRMNYAPCKAYNADFDGDEMNGHYVQNYVAKAEVHEIMIARKQYLVPKDGTPLLGLIQDHIISGVMLTLKDKFLTREDYNYLVLNAFPVRTDRIKTLPPTIIKPAVRWTGKQVISTVILNVIPPDQIPINLDGKAKTDVVNWQVEGHKVPERDMSESHVVFRGGELLVGVLDKAHYGPTPFGLIHSCYELYGPMVAGDILSALSRLFTTYLQIHGFTIGVKDILVSPQANKKRTKVIKSLRKCGPRVVRDAFELDEETEESDLRDLLRGIYTNAASKGDIKQLDFNMKQATDKFNDEINKACIPHGLIEKFPSNSLQLMIQAGAKGTMVNAMQISCMVGQIELEGCRPPLSATGRSLPSFKPYDLSPRAGGFVDQRFLTGLKPQELFFHTMAGREGLIDTAVKTSRSGYLQRCIIKHLEGIKVNYDHSVRDSDDSILQFQYGEDGMDICKVQYLGAKHFPFLKQNVKALLHSVAPSTKQKKIFAPAESTLPRIQEIEKWRAARPSNGHKLYASPFLSFCEKNEYSARMEFKNLPAYGDLVEKWHSCPASTAKKLRKKHKRCPDPILSTINSSQTIGCLSESFMDLLKEQGVKEKSVFREAINWKWLRSKAEPGENVGLLAAQSIGEPSTQMTLNTFHFAGRGEMNVTLGIPRLREILMVASKNLKTPTAEVPFRPGVPKAEAEKVRRDMDKVYLKSVLKGFQVEERITITEREFYRNYTVKVKLKSPKERPESDQLSRQKVMREMEDGFFKRLGWALNKRHQEVISLQELVHAQAKESAARRGAQLEDDALGDSGKGLMAADEGASSDEEGGAADSGATTSKYSKRHDDAAEYDGEEEEAKEPVFVLDSSFSEDEEEDSEEKEEEAEVEVDKAGRKTSLDPSQQMDPNRIAAVTKTSGLISEYQYDPKNHKWCTATFRLPMMKSKLDAATIVKIEIEKFVVYQTAGVEKTFLSVDGDNMILRTQGINLSAFFMRPEKLAVEKIRSNDIHMMLNTYGVEAAAKVLVQEVKGVFGNYGIEVNPRHLSLVSDYLMFTGEFRAFNRHYMDSHSSIMQRMTFETTTKYIKEGIIQGLADEVKSPSSAIILGTSMKGGTGAFDLYTPLDKALGIAKPVVVKAADAS